MLGLFLFSSWSFTPFVFLPFFLYLLTIESDLYPSTSVLLFFPSLVIHRLQSSSFFCAEWPPALALGKIYFTLMNVKCSNSLSMFANQNHFSVRSRTFSKNINLNLNQIMRRALKLSAYHAYKVVQGRGKGQKDKRIGWPSVGGGGLHDKGQDGYNAYACGRVCVFLVRYSCTLL